MSRRMTGLLQALLVALLLAACGDTSAPDAASAPRPAANDTEEPAAGEPAEFTGEIAEVGDCVEANEVEQLNLEASDGVKIVGVRWGKKGDGVVLSHMGGGDLCQWADNGAADIAKAGFQVVAIDLRGHGSSELADRVRETPEILAGIPEDVLAAVDHLSSNGAKNVYVIGASLGGAASIEAAAREPSKIDGVVALSAPGGNQFPSEWSAFAAASKLEMPALFIVSKDDPLNADSRKMSSAADAPLITLPDGSGHGTDILFSEPKILDQIIDFMNGTD